MLDSTSWQEEERPQEVEMPLVGHKACQSSVHEKEKQEEKQLTSFQ